MREMFVCEIKQTEIRDSIMLRKVLLLKCGSVKGLPCFNLAQSLIFCAIHILLISR